MFNTVLIANRGEIAARIARTLRRMGVKSVAVYSGADRNSAHVTAADAAVQIGTGDKPAESYLLGDAIIEAARRTGAQAVIPGYGFLSENTDFAAACAAAGLVFVGPTPEQIRQFGLKHESREIARRAGVPLVPGTGLLDSAAAALAEAEKLGYPVMLKSTAGGGGIGLTRCAGAEELEAAFEKVRRLGANFFKDSGVFLERCVDNARHVEVQIFGDGRGRVVALGERDCSIQRRNQKVVEETPAPNLPAATRAKLLAAAAALGRAAGYTSAGTVEFIYDGARDEFYFLEVNTRLQVEHPVTEAVTGIDLVEWMVRTAAGEPPELEEFVAKPEGAAIEVRLYAEDALKNFQPSPGVLTEVAFPEGVRVDGWVSTGTEVTPFYDPMIAKLIVHGKDRADAIAKMKDVLARSRVSGIATNLDYLRAIIASDEFAAGRVWTRFLDTFAYVPSAIEIIEAGTYTTVQDYPGRPGYWDVGVPPSGPMDDYAFRIANRIVGNHPSSAGLECTLAGPAIRFHRETVFALTGAPAPATLDGEPVAWWAPVRVKSGQVLRVGKAASGCRSYIAVRNGIDVPVYLGSKSTFVLGQFGGHGGRVLRAGDVLPVNDPASPVSSTPAPVAEPAAAPGTLVPVYPNFWHIGVMYGPHGAPDFFLEKSTAAFFEADWEVHYNSNRLGVRLIGPRPEWTRHDGGEAGLHPSNVHDCEYAVGSVNFTGDSPVILAHDGPSLGGFVCPVTIVKAELWKIGQVKPGDKIRFHRMAFDDALKMEKARDTAIATLEPPDGDIRPVVEAPERADTPAALGAGCVLASMPEIGERPEVVYRQAGDNYILIEYGPMVLDLRFRLRVYQLMQALRENPLAGVLELSPGVRSLQIRYDSRVITQKTLLAKLLTLEGRLPSLYKLRIPSRIVHLPMAWQDSGTLGAEARYRETIRAEAPWLPSNVEFIRRINGLDTVEDVRRAVFDASYMVLGLGDVYLGAPCAVPVDPRHRLVTSKYNPARTFTAEGTVGIGGVYMCIYGMDSPGGYQLVGRTLPIWNKFCKGGPFANGEPWLLKFFDQVRFFPVPEDELARMREAFREGRLPLKVEETVFDLEAHEKFLAENADGIAAFQSRQKTAFEAEVARWKAEDTRPGAPENAVVAPPAETDGHPVKVDISGNVWKLLVEKGAKVEAGQPLVIIEAMKMEINVGAPVAGEVNAVYCKPGSPVSAGSLLMTIAEG